MRGPCGGISEDPTKSCLQQSREKHKQHQQIKRPLPLSFYPRKSRNVLGGDGARGWKQTLPSLCPFAGPGGGEEGNSYKLYVRLSCYLNWLDFFHTWKWSFSHSWKCQIWPGGMEGDLWIMWPGRDRRVIKLCLDWSWWSADVQYTRQWSPFPYTTKSHPIQSFRPCIWLNIILWTVFYKNFYNSLSMLNWVIYSFPQKNWVFRMILFLKKSNPRNSISNQQPSH